MKRKILIEIETADECELCGACDWLDGTGYCPLFDHERLVLATLVKGNEVEFFRCKKCLEAELDAKAPGMRQDRERRDQEMKELAKRLFERHLMDEYSGSTGNKATLAINWAQRFMRTWEQYDLSKDGEEDV
jgi:hypothetical protein